MQRHENVTHGAYAIAREILKDLLISFNTDEGSMEEGVRPEVLTRRDPGLEAETVADDPDLDHSISGKHETF